MKAILECVASMKSWNKAFCLLFIPAMLFTLWGMVELYTTHYNLLTSEDHMGFFLRFFFPISIALLVTMLERRKRLKENAELKKKIEKYLDNQ